MLEKDFQQFLLEKHDTKEIKDVLNKLRTTAEQRYENAMEREDVYAIGFAAGTITSLEDAIQLIETLDKE